MSERRIFKQFLLFILKGGNVKWYVIVVALIPVIVNMIYTYTVMKRLKEIASGSSPRKLRKRLEREYASGRSSGWRAGGEAGWRTGGEAGWKSGDAPLPTVRDTISGFTAVILQHETDHLDGILYVDRL